MEWVLLLKPLLVLLFLVYSVLLALFALFVLHRDRPKQMAAIGWLDDRDGQPVALGASGEPYR